MDVLTDVLRAIHVTSMVSGRVELSAPWGLSFKGGNPAFCVVTRGTCWLSVEGIDQPIELCGGDFLVLPRGAGHAIRDSLDTPARPIEDVLENCPRERGCQPGGIFKFGGGGRSTTLVGGCFKVEAGAYNPLLLSLPPVIHVKGGGGTTVQWLESTLQFVAAEMAAGLPGAETIVNRLADILFVQAIRAHVAESGQEARGWLRALVDAQIGRALVLIHETPHAAWTVDSLADRVGMSRSAFAARFTELAGEPPLTYLTRWRMAIAARMLRDGSETIGQIAGRVGYEAEAAFNKAFKRWNGQPPGAFRRASARAVAPAS
jgi:AraC-like DNA-binding protein